MGSLFTELLDMLGRVLGLAVILVVLLVGVVVYFAFRRPKKKAKEQRADQMETLSAKGRANVMEVRRLAMRVKSPQVRTSSERICNLADKIMRELKEHEEKTSQVRQFFNYYLPTLASILSKYVRLEESGMSEPGMDEKTISFLEDIESAMNRQYASLFEDDKLDLAVEMEALTLACKRDGLLVGEEFHLREGDKDIVLTL